MCLTGSFSIFRPEKQCANVSSPDDETAGLLQQGVFNKARDHAENLPWPEKAGVML